MDDDKFATALRGSKYFSEPAVDEQEGLIRFGGQLTPDWLLDAYKHGVFPWPLCEYDVVAWWSPDPRAILPLEQLHVSSRLGRICRAGKFKVSCNQDFRGVIEGCATAQDRGEGTWLTPEMISAYCQMHELGHAHSVEAYLDAELVGGIYGIAIGGFFAAESKFYHQRDASKVALVGLVRHLASRGFTLLDIQQLTDHTERLGAIEIPRGSFFERLEKALALPVTFGEDLEGGPA